jgi:hypothetical protein
LEALLLETFTTALLEGYKAYSRRVLILPFLEMSGS